MTSFKISGAYELISKWIEASGDECIGPVREVYLRTAKRDGPAAGQNDPKTVTEIQYMVKKK